MNKKTGLSLYYSKIFFLRSEVDRLLTVSILFSCLMVAVRMVHTRHITFAFLVWNLFLAYIPYFISWRLAHKARWISNKFLFAFSFVVWLLFIPNSFYIITDLYHLSDHYNDYRVPQWYDLAMILSFAWNGLLLGVLSVRQMEKIMYSVRQHVNELFFIYPVMWLNALGVYVGRYLRFNSWDVLTDPFQLIRDIGGILLHPLTYRYASGMIICFSILMTIMYLTLKRISRMIW